MDEAEKYQQRLQAIAEKRRLQEEEDRAKREMEDQKLRVQQLKRKSLRDQWLMEGPPSSPDSPTPNSPVFSSPTEEAEPPTDKLQENQQTAGEKEGLPEQQDNDMAEDRKKDLTSPKEPPPASLENGQKEPSVQGDAMSASPEDVDSGEVKLDNGLQSSQAAGEPDTQPVRNSEAGPVPEEAAVIPNGTQEGKEEATAHSAAETPQQEEGAKTDSPQIPPENAQQGAEEGGKEATEAEPGKASVDEDAGEIIRAERVIVTDEGDEPADSEPAPSSESSASQPENSVPAPEGSAPALEGSAPAPEGSAPAPESSSPPPESSAPPPESSSPPPESSSPPPESTSPPPESSAPPPESSSPPPESSAPAPESSTSTPENSVPPPESSAPPSESFAPPPESSAPPPESSAPPHESSASAEGSVPEVPKPEAAEGPQDSEKEPQTEAPEAGAETRTGAEGNVEQAPASEAEPPAGSTEPDAVAPDVPVYPAELPLLAPQPEAEGEGGKAEEKVEAPASAPAVAAGQFQDIPLDGSAKPEAAKESEVQPATGTTEAPAEATEQQALLDPSKAVPARAEGGDAPKRKTCQCCSVM